MPNRKSHTVETKQKISDSNKLWANSKDGMAHRESKSKRMKAFAKTEEGKKHYKELGEFNKTRAITEEEHKNRSEAQSGSNNPRWTPFTLIVTLPTGIKEEHTFNGKSPYRDCADKFGLVSQMPKLKRGEEYTVQLINDSTKHPFPKGTIFKMHLINNNK